MKKIYIFMVAGLIGIHSIAQDKKTDNNSRSSPQGTYGFFQEMWKGLGKILVFGGAIAGFAALGLSQQGTNSLQRDELLLWSAFGLGIGYLLMRDNKKRPSGPPAPPADQQANKSE